MKVVIPFEEGIIMSYCPRQFITVPLLSQRSLRLVNECFGMILPTWDLLLN